MNKDTSKQPGSVEIGQASALLSRIEHKRRAVASSMALRAKLEAQTNKKEALSRAFREAKNTLTGNERMIESSQARYPQIERDIPRLRGEVARLDEEMTRVDAEIAAMSDELKRLEEVEIPGCMCAATVEDIQPYQQRLEALRADIARIDAAIAGQRELIREAEAAVTPVQDRGALRAKLLAEVAMGEADKQALGELDASIAADQAAYTASLESAAPAVELARQTIAALEARRSAIQAELANAESFTPEVIERLLLTEIDQACKRYVSQALAMREQFQGIVALENLLNRYASHPSAAVGGRYRVIDRNIALPLPIDAEFDALRLRAHPEALFRVFPSDVLDVEAFERATVERLRSAGCALLA